MPKFVLILMIRNESGILERCLKAVENVVDAYCILDTGSTDNTCDIATKFLETHEGCLTVEPWKDFGYNRSVSFTRAHAYLKDNGWDLRDTYGLLLDADMVFVPGALKQQTLGETGYTMVQCAGSLEYPNTRLVRMDFPWRCVGVTHEYWAGETKPLPKNVCYIDDRNDGGCKSDKFIRDAVLLERGLKEEPTNGRYMFYLAQTYNCLRRWKESAEMYKKRIQTGGWEEELWYSHYMIGKCYLELNDIPKFEMWMQRAIARRPTRAEPYYILAKYFREHSQHYKAYQYVLDGKKVPPSSDSLFIETDVYKFMFDYEASILEFYVCPDRKVGLRTSINYMLRTGVYQQNLLFNFQFYAQPIQSTQTNLGDKLPRPFGPDFKPSAISVDKYPLANVRYVNYWMDGGDYKVPTNSPVMTENAYINLETMEVIAKMDASTVGLPVHPVNVRGLEDIRLYRNGSDLCFTATTQEYSPEMVRVLQGKYGTDGTYSDCRILGSPHGRTCEKNWLPVNGTDIMIYDWCPLQTVDRAITISHTTPTPPLFSLFRGSAPPMMVGNRFWTLVHVAEYSKPRKYYHFFVETHSTHTPLRVTLPFVFRSPSVEYCVSTHMNDTTITCYVSFMDANPARVDIPIYELEWMNV